MSGTLPELVCALRPVAVPSQLIHGDLTGNVPFDSAQPPAIIDFSPYWRPTAYASAIVVADALIWEGADYHVLGAVAHISDFGQCLARALIFRAVTDWIGSQEEPANSAVEDRDPWARAVNIACQLAALPDPWNVSHIGRGQDVAHQMETRHQTTPGQAGHTCCHATTGLLSSILTQGRS